MTRITVDLVDTVTPLLEERVHSAARRLPHLRYADLRLEVTEAKGAGAENGTPKFSGDDQTLAIGVRVLAGDRMCAPGYVGLTSAWRTSRTSRGSSTRRSSRRTGGRWSTAR
jgi:hypothetical protein